MCEEVDRLAKMMDSLDETTQSNLLTHCCYLLGLEPQRSDVPMNDHVPMSELYLALTSSDLRQRMATLVDEVGVDGEFLVKSLFHAMIEFWERLADPADTPDAIARHLDARERVQRELEKPQADRNAPATDEQLKGFLEKLDELTMTVTARREQNADSLADLHELREKWFPSATGTISRTAPALADYFRAYEPLLFGLLGQLHRLLAFELAVSGPLICHGKTLSR